MLIRFLVSLLLFISVRGEDYDLDGEIAKVNPFDQTRQQFSSLFDALVDSRLYAQRFADAYRLPSLTFGLSIRGETVLTTAIGYKDVENQSPADVNTHYPIASISKTFAAALIAQLVEQEKISWNTPITSILSPENFPPKRWDNQDVTLTIGQLLSHTSGLRMTNLTGDFEKLWISPNNTMMIRKFLDDQLELEPGTKWVYSNYGYQLLGAVVEVLTGKTYVQAVTELIKKLDLSDTYAAVAGSPLVPNRARGYMRPNPKTMELTEPALFDHILFAEGYHAAGGLISNVPDLLRYGQHMIDAFKGRPDAFLSSETVRHMWTPHAEMEDHPFTQFSFLNLHYGYGWIISNITESTKFELDSKGWVWHAGGLSGGTSMLLLYPEQEIVGVALTNTGMVNNIEWPVIYAAENAVRYFHKLPKIET